MNDHRLQGIGMTSRRTRDRLIQRLMDQGIRRNDVLEAIRNTPRHMFIDEALSHRAYEDVALPIGYNQTISQPFVVARMTEAVMNNLPGDAGEARVLEIGTGCGYQAAVLARLVDHVFSIERIGALFERTRVRLRELDIRNVSLKLADGNYGWSQYAPFDAIITTAAAKDVPKVLLEQLTEGGVMVIPVGGDVLQELKVCRKQEGEVTTQVLDAVRFVPLLGGVIKNGD